MKIKLIAAACAALGSAAALAGPLPLGTTGTPPASVTTYYIAGASAQAQAVNDVAKSLFDTPADVVKITSTTVDAGNALKHVGFYGVRGGVNTLLVYRNSGGSGAGVRQLVSLTTAAYDALSAGNENNALNLNTCSAVAGASGSYTATCSSAAKQIPAVALSDVNINELVGGVLPTPGANYVAGSTINAVKTGLQGFGVAVNAALYAELVAQNAREGHPVDATGQPSISKAAYAALVSVEGGFVKDANALLNKTGDTTAIVVCRRTDTSGTQAASNLFFLNNVSGTVGYFGALNAESAPYTGVTYNLASSTGNATTCLDTAGGYRIGVLSLENVSTGTWKFVKIDGVSPDWTYDDKTGVKAIVADPKQRQQFAKGDYQFAYESVVAIRSTAPLAVQTLQTDLVAKLSDSTQSDLVGIAYEDFAAHWNLYNSSLTGATDNKQSSVQRSGNNSQPYVISY